MNLFFNKLYYEQIPSSVNNSEDNNKFNEVLADNNNTLFQTKFYDNDVMENSVAEHRFCMETKYPGLLIGTGYSHGAGLSGVDNDINCGFSFEYVSGQPYIPASSVKGLLRSCFKHHEVISEFCEKASGIVPELEKSIFGTTERDENGVDVFFDAVIKGTMRSDRRILGSDYITPHKVATDNPVPILILKVLPETVFEFRFLLKETVIENITVTIDEKLELFIRLLETFGIGAKTNVGYGVLTEFNGKLDSRNRPVERRKTNSDNIVKEKISLEIGSEYEGVVTQLQGGIAHIKVDNSDDRVRAKLNRKKPKNNERVKIKIIGETILGFEAAFID